MVCIIKFLLVDATIVEMCIVIVVFYIRSSLRQNNYHISPKILSQELEK